MASLYDTSYKGFSLTDSGSAFSFTNPIAPSTGLSLAETDKYKSPLTIDSYNLSGLELNLKNPAIQNSIATHAANVGGMTSEAKKYYEKANLANKISAYTSIAQGGMNLIDTYTTGRSNLRMTNKQLDMQKDLIDLNIKNTESVLTAQFKNAIADLQVVSAAKNVDISSQAVRSQIVAGGEDMGKDMADMRTQGKLQKLAIDFQKSVNEAQQRRNEQQAWINFGANIASSAMFLI